MKPIFTKLAADGSDLPADSTEKHLAVRVEHPLLKESIIVAAYRAADSVQWKNAATKAESHDAYGWKWRLPTVDELFLIVDRTRDTHGLDENFFPDAKDYEWTWSSTVYAQSPSVFAWLVALGVGGAGWLNQGSRVHVRAVRSSQ